jgi:tRNA G18 (ribose-2'-O)-methylase SpoU
MKKHRPNEASKKDIRVLLHNIRSAHNVGAMFRTADALGVTHVYLSGYSPCPTDRFLRPVKEIAKTALGAELTIPWNYHEDPNEVIAQLKREEFVVIGIEQDTRATDYKVYTPRDKTLVLVGSEVEGLALNLRDACDVFLEIPMRGMKESLNVSVAFAVVLFRIFDTEK